MGFYLRKSISVGPLRFNLSKSGIGVSAGVRGLRFGMGPRGNYVHVGRGGLYYRATLPPLTRTRQPQYLPAESPNLPISNATHAPLGEIDSADASQIVDSSSRELLEEINQKRARTRTWPGVSIVAALVLVVGASQHWPIWLLGLIVVAGFIGTHIVRARDELAKTVVLFYGFDPDMDVAYDKLHSAAKKLASCGAAWHIESSGKVHDRKYHAGASELVSRKSTVINTTPPPEVRTNIETIAIGVGRQTLHFFPDRVLIYDKTGVGAVSYPELRVEVKTTQFIESDTVPHDAEVIGRTWRYVNKSGGPDRRFNDNREIPMCRYEEIFLSSQSGLKELILVSRCGLGEEFAHAIAVLGKKLPTEEPVKAVQPSNVQATPDSANPLFNKAVAIVRESGRASISGLQRRLLIRHDAAVALMNELEAKGILGPVLQNGTRDIYIETSAPKPVSINSSPDLLFSAALEFARKITMVSLTLLQHEFKLDRDRAVDLLEKLKQAGHLIPSDEEGFDGFVVKPSRYAAVTEIKRLFRAQLSELGVAATVKTITQDVRTIRFEILPPPQFTNAQIKEIGRQLASSSSVIRVGVHRIHPEGHIGYTLPRGVLRQLHPEPWVIEYFSGLPPDGEGWADAFVTFTMEIEKRLNASGVDAQIVQVEPGLGFGRFTLSSIPLSPEEIWEKSLVWAKELGASLVEPLDEDQPVHIEAPYAALFGLLPGNNVR